MSAIGDGEDEFDVTYGSAGSSAIGDGFGIGDIPSSVSEAGSWTNVSQPGLLPFLFSFVFISPFSTCTLSHSTNCIFPFYNAPLIRYLHRLLAFHNNMYALHLLPFTFYLVPDLLLQTWRHHQLGIYTLVDECFMERSAIE